jgi:hypothetical protein
MLSMPHAFVSHPAFLAMAIACAAGSPALAAGEPVKLTLKDHGFAPAEIRAPANERFRIEISNLDATPAEFESSDLRAEKIIVPGGKITVTAGPLKPGTYTFFDDYHPDTAKGTLVVTEQHVGQ